MLSWRSHLYTLYSPSSITGSALFSSLFVYTTHIARMGMCLNIPPLLCLVISLCNTVQVVKVTVHPIHYILDRVGTGTVVEGSAVCAAKIRVEPSAYLQHP